MKLKKKYNKKSLWNKRNAVKKMRIEFRTKIIWYKILRGEIKNKFKLEHDKNKQIKMKRIKTKIEILIQPS
jgi:hypothetical protein